MNRTLVTTLLTTLVLGAALAAPTAAAGYASAPRNFFSGLAPDGTLLTWDAPTDNGGNAITSYFIVKYVKGPANQWHFIQSWTVSAETRDLVDENSHLAFTYFIRANTAAGPGAYASTGSPHQPSL